MDQIKYEKASSVETTILCIVAFICYSQTPDLPSSPFSFPFGNYIFVFSKSAVLVSVIDN